MQTQLESFKCVWCKTLITQSEQKKNDNLLIFMTNEVRWESFIASVKFFLVKQYFLFWKCGKDEKWKKSLSSSSPTSLNLLCTCFGRFVISRNSLWDGKAGKRFSQTSLKNPDNNFHKSLKNFPRKFQKILLASLIPLMELSCCWFARMVFPFFFLFFNLSAALKQN